MRKLGIVHISDAHLQKKNVTDIKKIVEKLIIDVEKISDETGQIANLVCFTGDLIQRGDYAKEVENEWDIKQVQNIDILKIVLFKMIFYYRSRYFGNDVSMDAKILEIIVDLEMRLNPNIDRGQKALVTKLMRGKLKRDI